MHTKNGGPEESWDCLLDPSDGDVFVTTPSELDLSDAVSGETTLFAPGLAVIQEEAVIQDASQAVFGEATRRRDRHLAVKGGLDVVVVRITCTVTGQAVTKPLVDVMHDIFEDASCLKSQMEGCSNGKVQINKGPNGGGVDIEVDDCSREPAARSAATRALASFLGQHPSTYSKTYFFYCMPPGIGFDAIAYAYLNSWLSVFNDEWCGYVSAQLHEIGHNLNLAHAGEGSSEYGDQTSVMGFSYGLDDLYMCFNVPNMFQLGWLTQVVELTSQPGHDVWWLVGHTNPGGLQALRLVGTPSSQDTYIWFNEAVGIHSQTQEGVNQVIVSTRPSGTSYGNSLLVAKLGVGGTYDPGNAYYSLRVISIENGMAQILLQPSTAAPVIAPSAAPIPDSTPAPVMAPTDSPVLDPTSAPVIPPTSVPVIPPTSAPVIPPTPVPVIPPTPAPVIPPTPPPVVCPAKAKNASQCPSGCSFKNKSCFRVVAPNIVTSPTSAPLVCRMPAKKASQCPPGYVFSNKCCSSVAGSRSVNKNN